MSAAEEKDAKSFTSQKLELQQLITGDKQVSDLGVRVALVLLKHVNKDTLACYPSQRTIADQMGELHESGIRRARRGIQNLKKTGWLSVKRGNRQKSNSYIFLTKRSNLIRDNLMMIRDKRVSDRADLVRQKISTDQIRHLSTDQIRHLPTDQIWAPNTLDDKHLTDEHLSNRAGSEYGSVDDSTKKDTDTALEYRRQSGGY